MKVKRGTLVQIGIPALVLAVALLLRVSAADTLLGTVLGAYLAYAVQQSTESRIHEAQFHSELIQQVLAPLYTEVHTKKEAFRRTKEDGEEPPLEVSVPSVSSNWLYSRLGDHLLRNIDEYTGALKAVEEIIDKPRNIAYTLAGRAASETFQEPKQIQTVMCSRSPRGLRAVTVDLLIGHNPFSGMKEGYLVLGDGSVTKMIQFPAEKDLCEKFWKTAEALASNDLDIKNLREAFEEANDRTVKLDHELDREIERLRR